MFPLLYVVSYKLFWNWNGVVRFVSQEVWFDKGFIIWQFFNTVWYKLCLYVSFDFNVSYSSCWGYSLINTLKLNKNLWSLNIGVGIFFTTNELVDRTRNFKSNASRFEQKNYEKNAPQARFLMEQNLPQAKLIKQNVPQARIFDAVLMSTLSYLYGMYFIFHKSQLKIFFF